MRRFLSGSAMAGALVALTALSAGALIEGPCDAYFNGIHFDGIDTAEEAKQRLVLQPGETLVFSGTVGGDVDEVSIDLVVRPWTVNLVSVSDPDDVSGGASESWLVEIPVDDLAVIGVGIYEFRGRTDICSGSAFFVVEGDPFETLIGRIALVFIGLGGLIAVVSWLISLFTGTTGRISSVFGGVLVGLGGAIYAQQAGFAPLSLPSVVLGMVAGTAGVLLISLLCVGINRIFRRGGGAKTAPAAPVPQRPPHTAGAAAPAPNTGTEPARSSSIEEVFDEHMGSPNPQASEGEGDPGLAPPPSPALAALGAGAAASLARATQLRNQGGQSAGEPFWFYVESAAPVFGMDGGQRQIAEAVPGVWYLARGTYGDWVHMQDADDGWEGWVPGWAAKPQPT